MSFGFGSQHSRASSKAKPVAWDWQKKGLQDLSGMFRNLVGGNGFLTALSQPLGILNPAFQNLFGDNPSADFLGARSRLQDVLSERALPRAVDQAMGALLPWMQRESDIMRRDLLQRAGHTGTRFSTDFANVLNRGQQDLALRTQQQALGVALPYLQTQAQAARSVYDMIASLAERQLARQVPLWAQILTAYAPVGSSSRSSSGGWRFSIGLNSNSGYTGF